MAAVTFAAIVTAAAIVAKVSFYVAMTALALKVVGKVTGNKTLTKIGTYMGYAALIGGIGSLGVMGADTLMDMASGPIIEGSISGSETVASSVATDQASSIATDQGAKLATDAVSNAGVTMADPNAIHPVWGNTLAAQQRSLDLGAQVTAGVPDIGVSGQGFETDPFGAASSPQPEASAQAPASASAETGAKAAIVEPSATATGSQADPSTVNIRDPNGNFRIPVGGLLGPQQGVVTPTDPGWWKGIDPSVKAMGGLAVGQTLAGAAQGWFAGQSAEEKLAFDKQVNAQRQTELERRISNASNTPIVYRNANGILQQGRA